ncbi:hypothetical protein GCM10008906_08360 [Clostridium oceanicum]|uniref:DUF1146 domain-containing protein n=1 Tax=Clostridium oceanicum TaxID=1543 RepID=A0ABN1JBL9_9CLOT
MNKDKIVIYIWFLLIILYFILKRKINSTFKNKFSKKVYYTFLTVFLVSSVAFLLYLYVTFMIDGF